MQVIPITKTKVRLFFITYEITTEMETKKKEFTTHIFPAWRLFTLLLSYRHNAVILAWFNYCKDVSPE